MKKLFLALATVLSISSLSEAAKIVITNDSSYTVQVWTTKLPNPFSNPWVEAGQKLVLDLPDNTNTTVKMYRINMKAAGENLCGIFNRMTTAEIPTKTNGLEWLGAAYSFGKSVYKSYPVTRVTVNPSQVTEGQVKNIIITDYEDNKSTISAKLFDKDVTDFQDLDLSETEDSTDLSNFTLIENTSEEKEIKESFEDTESYLVDLSNALNEAAQLVEEHKQYGTEFDKIEMNGSFECFQAIKNLIEKIKLETTEEIEITEENINTPNDNSENSEKKSPNTDDKI